MFMQNHHLPKVFFQGKRKKGCLSSLNLLIPKHHSSPSSRKRGIGTLLLGWLFLGGFFLALPVAAYSLQSDRALERIALVPVNLRHFQGEGILWDRAVIGMIAEYWYWASSGHFVPQLRMYSAIYWDSYEKLQLPIHIEQLTPALDLILNTHSETGIQAYAFLFPYGSLHGGFFVPPDLLVRKGYPPLSVMGADRPQALLHEIGHALGLKDQYRPGTINLRTFTLMAWTEDLIPPLDPIARTALGWSRVIEPPLDAQSFHTRLAPEDVVRLAVQWGGTLWFALQPLVNFTGVEGWMVELDYLPPADSWQRVQMDLMGPKERKEGVYTLGNVEGRYEFHWSFSPTPPRVELLVVKKFPYDAPGFACTLVPPFSFPTQKLAPSSFYSWADGKNSFESFESPSISFHFFQGFTLIVLCLGIGWVLLRRYC